MQQDHDPIVYLTRQNGKKIAVCLSFVGKWLAGIIATVSASLIIGMFVFAWQSNAALGSILTKLDAIDDQMTGFDRRMDRYGDRLDKINDKLDTKEDKQ